MDTDITKMRIKLYKGLDLVSDRLVGQDLEFRTGPKEIWKEAIVLEINLKGQEDVDSALQYLKKLKGDLPIGEKAKKTPKDKTLNKMLQDKEPLLDLIKTVKARGSSQEKVIEVLREYNFRFLSTNFVKDTAGKDMIQLRGEHEEYQWMVRLIKEAKDCTKDRYDYRLAFGIKIIGDRGTRIKVYLWGQFSESLTIPWEKKKGTNFKKVEKIYLFPEMMDYDDRKKWRNENRKMERLMKKEAAMETVEQKEKFLKDNASKFYTKWRPYIKGY